MTREHLETLTHEELIDLILQLQTAVTEVKAKVVELEAQLAGKKPPPKTSTNSSVPPSSQRKGNNRNLQVPGETSAAQSMVMWARVVLG
ncbi:MAG: hypothetical protein JRJ45_10460 [Deltaproteobacteria bacterium]|nr:hypothetical protein [Deltaproteobacteria bacterium]